MLGLTKLKANTDLGGLEGKSKQILTIGYKRKPPADTGGDTQKLTQCVTPSVPDIPNRAKCARSKVLWLLTANQDTVASVSSKIARNSLILL